jgi:plasmid stabilization system protein ParE
VRKFHVEITRTAESDITSIFEYISQDSSDAAGKWVEEVERQIDSLEAFPARCPVIHEAKELEKEYRPLIYGNYRSIFRIQGSKVIIVRVIHGARLLELEQKDREGLEVAEARDIPKE